MFRQAHIDEYVAWLRGYLESGGKITHCYDYPWARAEFFVAVSDFRLGGECGSLARPILVAPGARWLSGERGHNNLYRLSDFASLGGWVPVYKDSAFDSLPGIENARRRERQAQAAWDAERERQEEVFRQMRETSDLSRYLGMV